MSATSVRVRVPATSANLGPGFDAFGLCLDLYDEVEVRLTGGGLRIDVTGEGAGEVPTSEDHLVVRALYRGFDAFGERPAGLELTCANRIPHSRGLGSSAAAICAGLVAACALAHGVDGVAKRADELYALATDLEGHPDNVAACLRGGFTLAWSTDGAPGVLRLEPVAELRPVAFVPADGVSTAAARGLLPAAVPHADAAANAGRAALLVAALTRHPELLLPATEDRLHQAYRAPAMPASAELVAALRADGVPAVVSGAGPTVLALTRRDAVEAVAGTAPDGWAVHRLAVDRTGSTVLALS